jgi:hypothetical protein
MKRRDVRYADVNECIADVERLRAGCQSGGEWSLAQACWHLENPVTRAMHPPETTDLTPEQQKLHAFIDERIVSGWPSGRKAPDDMVPPADAGPEAIDRYIAALRRLWAYELPFVDSFRFGAVDTEKFRHFMLSHAAHHLSFFEPEGAAGG